MTDYTTSHYDFDDTIGSTIHTLDVIKNMMAVADHDVIPESREDNVIAGTELNASSLGLNRNTYTTLPLKPASHDINFLYENYIHQQFNMEYEVDIEGNLTKDLLVAAYSPMSGTLPSRNQLLLGNSPIWENTFHRLESIASLASLPQEIVQTNPEIVTMTKLLNQEPIPGSYLTIPTKDYRTKETLEFKTLIDCNIDLNTYIPILSNLPFIANFMGNLRLRMFYEDLHRALCVTPLPINKGELNDKFHVLERIPFNQEFEVDGVKITFRLKNWEAFSTGCEIVQANYSIKEGSIEAMKRYVEQDNKLLIPTQTWAVTNSGQQPPSHSGGNEFVFQINAYNIHLLAFMFPYNESQVYYPQPRMSNIDIKLNGKSINYIPYKNFGPRTYKDTAQAFLNDDKYGINENLLNSMLSSGYNGKNNGEYSVDVWNEMYDNKPWVHVVQQPNNFVLAKGLSPPDCFECGMCTFNSNPQSTQIRYTYNLVDGTNYTDEGLAPPDYTTSNINPFCLALQDCCILLSYNKYTQTCQSGTVEYASPVIA